MELLLVLTVLVSAAAVVWPSVQRLHDQHQLNQAVEEVRVQLARARLRCIETGTTFQFRYQPGGRRYSMGPAETAPLASPQDTGNAVSQTVAGQLPEGLRFTELEPQTLTSSSTNQAMMNQPMMTGLSAPNGESAAGWSSPILFQPDGSAVDAAFTVTDSEQRSIRLSVRGLTGAVQVGRVERSLEP